MKHSRRTVLKWFGAGAVSAVGAATFGGVGTDWLQIERRTLALPNWDAGRFRLALLGDIHVNFPAARERARAAVLAAIAEKPNLLVFAGDFLNDAKPETLENVRETFEPLRNVPFPCVAVMGNHDYWTPYTSLVMDTIRATSLKLLRNEALDLNGVTVAGVDDAVMGHMNLEFLKKGHHARSLIAVLHEPDYVEEMPDHVSIQLSGHSHGGQICLPFGYALHTPRGARKYIRGYFPEARVPLYVTRGVGTTGPDVRLFCRPELSILTLESA